MRITVIVPESLMEAASHVHVLLGKANHLNTYTVANWQDAEGNLYAVSSGIWTEAQIAGVTNPDVLAGIELPEGVDLALVAQAQAAFSLDDESTTADPAQIIAMAGGNPLEALEAAGLSIVPSDLGDSDV